MSEEQLKNLSTVHTVFSELDGGSDVDDIADENIKGATCALEMIYERIKRRGTSRIPKQLEEIRF